MNETESRSGIKAKVAAVALKGDKTLTELAEHFGRTSHPDHGLEAALAGTGRRRVWRHDWSSVSGMKSRVQRGRRQLRDMLEACCVIALDRRRGVADYDVRNQQNNLCRDRPDCGALDTREK